MDKWEVVEEIEELIDKAVSDLNSDDVDWILKRVKDTVEELLEE